MEDSRAAPGGSRRAAEGGPEGGRKREGARAGGGGGGDGGGPSPSRRRGERREQPGARWRRRLAPAPPPPPPPPPPPSPSRSLHLPWIWPVAGAQKSLRGGGLRWSCFSSPGCTVSVLVPAPRSLNKAGATPGPEASRTGGSPRNRQRPRPPAGQRPGEGWM